MEVHVEESKSENDGPKRLLDLLSRVLLFISCYHKELQRKIFLQNFGTSPMNRFKASVAVIAYKRCK